ncbi:type III PLP-dependent enzyme domain-containing protein [Acinetobacter stercoris]|uniref:Diaminopimelate decarboxylase n=1 Tax=Acinetobacter stercoris TaxID=2126983 RepID=A0A2U3MXJ9_9GAMM|nr:amino acid decarboxylase [Acinetobacter stercoris]SPL70029.1 Diaminopimelate decarboxylase [Acinetobacter stercoris]
MQHLNALRHPLVERILSHYPDEIFQLIRGIGSPLHLVFPKIFVENIQRFKKVLSDAEVDSTVLFAKKSNKADCFIQTCREQEIGVDVASIGELSKTLSLGIRGDSIGVSGPEKDLALLQLAVQHECLIAIDSLSELNKLLYLTEHSHKKCRILCRVVIPEYEKTRFGLSPAELEQLFKICLSHSTRIELFGFSFHLSGYDIGARARAANFLIEYCLKARQLGLTSCHCVDIGGGFPVQYVEQQAWDDFQRYDIAKHYHAEKHFKDFYPYASPCTGADSLKAILEFDVESGISLKQKLKHHHLHLIIEPGRALLDQAGLSAFRIQGIKNKKLEKEQYAILTVEGSSFSLSEQWFNTEFLPDPVLLTRKPLTQKEFIACIAGASCLEVDMLSWRKIRFQQIASLGDLCIYLNTAGYQMDSNESSFHESKIPLKVVVELNNEKFDWHIDDQTRHVQDMNFINKIESVIK